MVRCQKLDKPFKCNLPILKTYEINLSSTTLRIDITFCLYSSSADSLCKYESCITPLGKQWIYTEYGSMYTDH